MIAGFGFVTFANRADAQSVIEKLNLQPMGGRKVAIDWAIDRRQHQTGECRGLSAKV